MQTNQVFGIDSCYLLDTVYIRSGKEFRERFIIVNKHEAKYFLHYE